MNLKEIKNNNPQISPVPYGTKRPLWSVMIPTYNPGKYFIDAINSVLKQDPGEEFMQIEVVDDCSQKVDVKKIVMDNWNGRVKYYRLPKNVGHSFNFTESIRRSRGEYVHILHDDDMVKEGFYPKFNNIFKEFPGIGAAFCRQEYIDEESKVKFNSDLEMESKGILNNALIRLAQKQRIQYCAMVVKRSTFENIGGFIAKNIGCEDWEMWVRIAAFYPIAYEPEALAQYRVHHGTSMTLKDMRSGQDMRYMREAINIFNEYLPQEKREDVDLFRRRYYGTYSFKNAKRLDEEFNDKTGAAAQLSETIRIDSELIYKNLDYLNSLETPIENAGVSVILSTSNNHETIERTLRHLIIQKVPDYIPWEIIVSDNNSTDGTLEIIKKTWEKYNGRSPFTIIKTKEQGIVEIRNEAIDQAKYNFILFCNPGDHLNRNYVQRVSENMMRDIYLGVLGGYSEPVINTEKPEWFDKWSNQSYNVGEQYEYTSAITWTRGYVWSSGMAIRKEAWKELYERNFKTVFPNAKNNILKSGIDKELSYALRLCGWSVWYSIDLQLKHRFTESELVWRHLRNIWKQDGTNFIKFYNYTHTKEHKYKDLRKLSDKKNLRKLITSAYRDLKRYKKWKLRSYDQSLYKDPDILSIEFHFSKLNALLDEIKSYNKRIRILRRIARKSDFEYLKFVTGKTYFRFPQYKRTNDKRGISIILQQTNPSFRLLYRSLEKIYSQILPDEFLWEVILVSKFIDTNKKHQILRDWERSNCSASLKLVSEFEIEEESLTDFAINRSKYKYLIFLNEFTLINSDYVRIAYKVMNRNRAAGFIGGQTKLISDVKPPKWISDYKELYSIGKQSEGSGDITNSKGYLWNTGIVARKTALTEISKIKIDNEIPSLKKVELFYDPLLFTQIKFSDWKLYYEERLRSQHFLRVGQMRWEYLRKLYYSLGCEEVLKESYSAELSDVNKVNNGKFKRSWIYRAKDTLMDMNKYSYKKIFSGENEFINDTDVLEIEKLQGKFSEIIKIKDKYNEDPAVKRLNGNGADRNVQKHDPVNKDKSTPGVSIIICCYNSSGLLPKTLEHLFLQKVPDNIPWEIIIVDNASTDKTYESAYNLWERSNSLVPFKIVKEPEPGLSAARLKGFQTAKFDYVVFCDDDNWLHKDFVKTAFGIMQSNQDIGVLGGQSRAEFDVLEPKWFKDWQNSYAIGRQSDTDGDLTISRGYVWGASMIVRKQAWNNLLSKGFRSILTDRKGNTLSAGGDTEICYALRNEGWKIWYDHRLKFKHYISEKRLSWKYLRKLFRGFGQASPGLDYYQRLIPVKTSDPLKPEKNLSIKHELKKTLSILRKTGYNKLLSYETERKGDSDIPMIEYCLGRIEGLLKLRGTYNRGIKTLKRSVRKKDLKHLKSVFKDYDKNFPRYKTIKKLNGVSVIVCAYNGEDRLADTVRHIAKQKTDNRLLWEFILVDNASTDNTKQVAINEWKRHNVKANLIIVDEFEQGLSAARQKGFQTAKYEYIVLCDDDNWLDEKFVQTTFDIMSSNDKIGILGGPNDALCELDPPEWFQWFQHGYAAGVQADFTNNKVTEGNITWKRGFVWGAGMIIRKRALDELYSKGFTSLMSDRKGAQLSSGGDSELCFALVLSGWQVWYDSRLKLKHCMPAGRVSWEYLIRLFQGFGITSVGLDHYEKSIKLGRADSDPEEIIKQNWKYEYNKTLKEVKKYGIKKLLSLRFSQHENTAVPMMEFHLARLKELRRVKDIYDKNFENVRNANWRTDNKKLKSSHRTFIETENDFRYGWPWISTPAIPETSQNQYPKISILSPSFNSVNTIEKAILSVLNQGYPEFEHIIYDGGSTDGTIEILKKYPHLIWISEPDKGQCDAMNKAFDKSTGDIISYLNVDDYYQRGVFNKIADAFKKDPEADMVVGNLFFEFDDHTHIREPEIDYKKIMLPFRYIFPINPVSYFYKKEVQRSTGPFPLDNHYTMDYWFLLKAYQNNKIVKINDYLGTFCMNGFNKTSGADNRKNTHHRVVEHCWKYDRKNLPYYLYNYYKFYYYEEKPYNLKRVRYKLKKNFSRVFSIITLKKNKYYSNRLYESARIHYYLNRRFKSVLRLLISFAIYPKGINQRSKKSLFAYSFVGAKNTEKAKLAYNFLTTPPGLPLANKLHYYGKKYKEEKKGFKGNSLLFLTYVISPKFLFNSDKDKKGSDKSNISKRSFFFYLNPFNWIRGFINFFKYKRYKSISHRYFNKAGEKFYLRKNFQATTFVILSFMFHPKSLKSSSRLNLLSYSALGESLTDKIRFTYHLYKDNPENSFAHKINYYGNELRKEGSIGKGNLILLCSYILSPKYISKREKIKKSNAVYVSDFIEEKKKKVLIPTDWANSSINQLKRIKYQKGSLRKYLSDSGEMAIYRVKSIYFYFRYRKFKAKSKIYYAQAIENYKNDKRFDTIKALIPSYLLYPVSIFNRNKLSLIKNSIFKSSRKSSDKKVVVNKTEKK